MKYRYERKIAVHSQRLFTYEGVERSVAYLLRHMFDTNKENNEPGSPIFKIENCLMPDPIPQGLKIEWGFLEENDLKVQD